MVTDDDKREADSEANDETQNTPGGEVLRPMMEPAEDRKDELTKLQEELDKRENA